MFWTGCACRAISAGPSKKLYTNVIMFIGPPGPGAFRFLATRGMKQDSPLSCVLFALVLDP
eukprot:5171239-Pyramimonas_sp.AAC.1